MVKVIIFGQLTEVIGHNEINIDGCKNILELRMKLGSTYTQMEGKKYNIALDNQIVEDEYIINEEATVYLLPPYSGG
jgi:sulfur-carrier protein